MKINSIQILRAVAVILVTHAHSVDLQMAFSVSRQQNFYYLQNLGAIGVDLFFVISGFIICYVAGKYSDTRSGIKFLEKRYFRINPIYYVASLIFLALQLLLQSNLNVNEVIAKSVNTILILPVTPVQSLTFAPLLVIGWSLSFEWLFYLLFFCTISLRFTNKTGPLTLLILVLVIIGRIYHPNVLVTFYTHPLLLEFLFGVIAYWLYNNVTISKGISFACLFLGIGGYIFNIFHNFHSISELPNIIDGGDQLNRVMLWGVPSFFLFTGSIFVEKSNHLNRLWNNSYLLLLGDASYSIYLTHTIFYYLLALPYIKLGFFLNPDLAIILQMAIGIVGGVFFYKKVEVPIVSYFRPTTLKSGVNVVS